MMMREQDMDSSTNRKPSLPYGWVVETSKTYPNRIYYFNVITGAASWKCPQLSDADSSECVEPPRSMGNNKRTQEADSSLPTECSQSLQQTKTGGVTDSHCKRRISFNESATIYQAPDSSKVNITSSSLKTETVSVPSKCVKTTTRLKKPALENNYGSEGNPKPERIILKAKRHLQPSKSEEPSNKREVVHLSKNCTTVKPSNKLSTSSYDKSLLSPASKKKAVNHVISKRVINLKDNNSRFRRASDQRPPTGKKELSELSGDVSSFPNNDSLDQDVEMPDLSELLTNEESPEPMQTEEIPCNNGLFIVVDTNVFLYNLKYIENLMETAYEGWGYPNIRIPWTVIQELDALKNNKDGKGSGIVHKAADAVRFVYKMLQCKHPRIRGQTAADASKSSGDFNAECNDDKILQYCIQLSESVGKKNVFLLTEDKNLCNKAFINDIEVHVIKTLQKDLKICQEKKDEKPEETVSMEKKEKKQRRLEELVNEAKVITKDLLSLVVKSEMKQAFDELWEKVIISKPPWTLIGVLECLLRHWMAVFGFLFQHDMKKTCEELLLLLKHGSRDPEDEHKVTKLFDLTSTICTCVYIKYGSESADESLNQLEEIKKKWQALYRSESEEEVQDTDGIVFSSFSFVWTVMNHVCGIVQDTLNYQLSILYERPPVLPNREEIIQLIPKVHKKLEQLYKEMNVLITATATDVNYKKAVFEFLITFRTFTENLGIQLPSFPPLKRVTPEMLERYCTNVNNKEKLKNGHCQLNHFLCLVERIAKDVCL